jgi:hypothetical protein
VDDALLKRETMNLEIAIWGLLAALIRVLKDYVTRSIFSLWKSILTVSAGTSTAYLVTPIIIEYYSLPIQYISSISFAVGLIGKDLIELILKADVSNYIYVDESGVRFQFKSTAATKKKKN